MSGMTAEAREIMAYLKKHSLADQLNHIVNKLCKKRSEDPFGFLATKLHSLASAPVITKVSGREVLSSSGAPTIQVDVHCKVDDVVKFVARATGSLGAPDGKKDSVDGDAEWYHGMGVKKAVTNITEVAHSAVAGLEPNDQSQCDSTLLKSSAKISPAAMRAASIAICKTAAKLSGVEAFAHVKANLVLADQKKPPTTTYSMPRPMVQLIRGKNTLGCSLEFSEILVYPKPSVKGFQKQLEVCSRLHFQIGESIAAKFGASFKAGASTGGYCPPVGDVSEALKLVADAAQAGNVDWKSVGVALCTGGFGDEGYVVKPKDKPKSLEEMIEFYLALMKECPGLNILIDPVEAKDADGLVKIKAAIAADEELKERGIAVVVGASTKEEAKSVEPAADGVALSMGSFPTVTDAVGAMAAAGGACGPGGGGDEGKADGKTKLLFVCCDGDSEETFMADLAVGVDASFVKFGGLLGAQATAKYNRMLQIEELVR